MDPEALQFIKPMVNVTVHYHKVMRYDLLLIAHQSPIWLYFSVLHFILRDIEVKMAFWCQIYDKYCKPLRGLFSESF